MPSDDVQPGAPDKPVSPEQPPADWDDDVFALVEVTGVHPGLSEAVAAYVPDEDAPAESAIERLADEPTQALAFDDEASLAERAAEAFEEAVEDIVIAAETTDERPTEWFSFGADSQEPDAPALPRRTHHVTGVIVSHDGATWLPAVLTTLAQQTRPLNAVIGIDSGSTDTSADLLRGSLGDDRVIAMPDSTGFGDAVRAGLVAADEHFAAFVVDQAAAGLPGVPDDAVRWVWLLHDDSAPNAKCLQALLDTADDNPSAGILGPKILGWHDRRLLLEAGVSVTGSGRRFTGLESREHDQGQHDGVRDVMSVSSAGMLVRRDIWDALDGFDPALPLFRDDLDFCWRAHRAGERVLIATDAVVHHREASAHGRRTGDLDVRPHRADRNAAAHVLLAQASKLGVVLTTLRLLIGSSVRSVAYLLGKDVSAAGDEIGAVIDLVRHPSRVRASRELIARTSTESATVVNHLRPSSWSQMRHALEAAAGVAMTSNVAESASVSALASGPLDEDAEYLDTGDSRWLRRVLMRPSVIFIGVLTLFAIIATRGLWLGDGVLQGGALLPAPEGASDLWEQYSQAWHNVGPGSTIAAAPYLMIVWATAAVLLGKAQLAVTIIMLLGVPLAGWSAYLALRGVIHSTSIRIWSAASYALLPAVTGAVSAGRIGTVIAAILLPFAVRSVARLASPVGTWRRAAGTAIIIAAVAAAVPGLWLIAFVSAAVIIAIGWRRDAAATLPIARRLALAILTPLVLLLPWSLRLLLNPQLFLVQPGIASASLTDPNITAIDVLMLHPGGPASMPLWVTAGILLAGVLSVVRRARIMPIIAALGVGAVALLFGVVQTVIVITPPDGTAPLRPWPGPATLVLGAGLLVAAALAADGFRERISGASFGVLQPLAAVVAVIALLAPLAVAVTWFPNAEGELRRAPASTVPAFVRADALSPQAPRTLVLRQQPDGRVLYSLINGAGPILGDAEVTPGAQTWDRLDPLVAALASGRGGEEVPTLAGYGVRYVLLASGSAKALVPVLDGAPGLRRLSSAGGEVLWRVAGTTSRARVVEQTDDGEKITPVGVQQGERLSVTPYIDQRLPEGGAQRLLVIGAAVDDGWSAKVRLDDGGTQTLDPVAATGIYAWAQAYAVPSGSPVLDVNFPQGVRTLWLWLQLVVLLALVVLALPSRQVHEDYDIDGEVQT